MIGDGNLSSASMNIGILTVCVTKIADEPKRRLDAVTQRLIIQKTRENKTHEGAKHGHNTE